MIGSTDRPYISLGIADLEALFTKQGDDPALLEALENELRHRTVPRAVDLLSRVTARRKTIEREALKTPSPRPSTVAVSHTETVPPADPVSASQSSSSEAFPMTQSQPATSRPHAAPQPPLSDTHRRLIDLIDYVEHMVRLTEKPAFTLRAHGHLAFHEAQLRGRIGIHIDTEDENGPAWLRIERLKRIDPPPRPELAAPWVEVSRDPLREVTVKPMRVVTLPEDEARRLIEQGEAEERDLQPSPKDTAGKVDLILRLDRHPRAKAAVETYVGGAWTRWAEDEKPRRQTIAIYDAFFSLHQSLQGHGSDKPLELVFGVGIARWKVKGQDIDLPLIEQLAELEIAGDGSLVLRPRAVDPAPALKAFLNLELDGADRVLAYAREQLGTADDDNAFNPFHAETFSSILRYAHSNLDPQGRYWPDEVADLTDRSLPPISDTLTVTDTWVVFARPRSDNFFIADLERLKDSVKDAPVLPGAGERLVTPPSDVVSYTPSLIDLGTGQLGASCPGPAATECGAAGDSGELFFPKPFNEDQVTIIRRLNGSDGVVVQGPPGTGKTHTIANIICHALATGRRVLVTSKTEGALSVLREHLPDGIRDLTISLLTNEREGLKQLETAVTMLATSASRDDPRRLEREIADTESRILALRGQIATIDSELVAFAHKHLTPVPAGPDGQPLRPAEIAERLARSDLEFDWLADEVTEDPRFDEADIVALRDARRALGADLSLAGISLPSPSHLPDAARIDRLHQDLAAAHQLEQRVRSGTLAAVSLSTPNAVERIEALIPLVSDIAAGLAEIEADSWLLDLTRLWERHGENGEPLRLLNEQVPAILAVVSRRLDILGHAVELPADAHEDDDLLEAIRKVAAGERPFGLLAFGKREVKARFEAVRIAAQPARAPEDWRKVEATLLWRREVGAVTARWRVLVAEYGVPDLADEGETAARRLATLTGRIESAKDLVTRARNEARRELATLIHHGLDVDSALASEELARSTLEILRLNLSRLRLAEARDTVATLKRLFAGLKGPVATQARAVVDDLLGNPTHDVATVSDAWIALCREIDRLQGLSPAFATVARVAGLVRQSGAPKWAAALESEPVTGLDDSWTRADWREIWRGKRLGAYLASIDGRERIRDLSTRRLHLDADLKKAFAEVVRLRTYLGLRARLSDRVMSELVKFLKALQKFGKGMGKGAAIALKDARTAMEKSYGAIPCWIMPTWRVSETLPSVLGSFDLVIVDEASQSDISALPALVRGRKVLIVGDDKQVSPTAAFIPTHKLIQLRHNYLKGQPFESLLLPGSSLYDLALAAFPGTRVMLREHFRCVEPIIRFSVQFYTEEIIPVRVPRASERLDPPLIDVLVSEGRKDRRQINVAEAKAIVDEIELLVSDPRYHGRSIGVISLIAAQQAHYIQQLLLERIGEDTFLRHSIACGDSATFQGKERDIVFLSMVACPASKSSKTAAIFQQRFNVALSRARDRMYLFRSVTEEMLNPDDLKAMVIRHFREPMAGRTPAPNDLIDLCESGFEREVFTWLTGQGYRVTPQVKVGPFRIDLVVEGAEDRRLAVELDGDKYHTPERWADDFARQRVLERVGWRFWRCWGSSFALDPAGCLADLQATLSSLGIEPLGGETAPPIHTEHRVLGRETAPAAPGESSSPPADGAVQGIDIGDKVVMAYSDKPNRHLTIVISAEQSDPDLGIVHASHPIAQALLGAQVEDEVEIPAAGSTRVAVVLSVEKDALAA